MSREITKIVPKSDALKRRFPDGDIIDLSIIGGWEEIETDQQRYLIEFVENFPKKVQPALRCGIDTDKMYSWFKNDASFLRVVRAIHDLYTESLRFLNFEDAMENSKVRAKELKALGSDGYKTKSSQQIQNQQNNIFVGDGKKGLAGLVEAVNEANQNK